MYVRWRAYITIIVTQMSGIFTLIVSGFGIKSISATLRVFTFLCLFLLRLRLPRVSFVFKLVAKEEKHQAI